MVISKFQVEVSDIRLLCCRKLVKFLFSLFAFNIRVIIDLSVVFVRVCSFVFFLFRRKNHLPTDERILIIKSFVVKREAGRASFQLTYRIPPRARVEFAYAHASRIGIPAPFSEHTSGMRVFIRITKENAVREISHRQNFNGRQPIKSTSTKRDVDRDDVEGADTGDS